MKTIATSVAMAIALALGGAFPALAQGTDQVEVPIACLIDYEDIGLVVTDGGEVKDEELVLDGPGQSCEVELVGTPPDEKIRLRAEDLVDPVPRPLRERKFKCQVFRGRRGGEEFFEITTNSDITVDRQGRVSMTCTAG